MLPPSGRRNFHLLRGRYPPVIALTGSCATPHGLSHPFGIQPRSKSLCRLYSVPAAHGSFPTLSLKIFPWMLYPVPRRSHRVLLPFLPRRHRPSPSEDGVGFPLQSANHDFSRVRVFEAADIPQRSGLQVCSPPRSSLPLRVSPQGSRGFYIRAYRASLPPHAPDMLTVRIQAIDGTGTFTPLDSQPCRLLTSPPGPLRTAMRMSVIFKSDAMEFRLTFWGYASRSAMRPNPAAAAPIPRNLRRPIVRPFVDMTLLLATKTDSRLGTGPLYPDLCIRAYFRSRCSPARRFIPSRTTSPAR